MRKTIEQIAKIFNQRELTWAIGGSYLLKKYGIENKLNHIDVMVSADSVKEMNEVMDVIANKLEVTNNDGFQTEHFTSYELNGEIINVIYNLKCDFNEPFTYSFNKNDIDTLEISNNEKIYFSHLLDWYVIYQEIDFKETTDLIENSFESGLFLDNPRFNEKFGLSMIPNTKSKYEYLKKRIYHNG